MKIRHKQYAANIYSGMSQREAYIDVYHPIAGEQSIDTMASRLFNKVEVQREIDRLLVSENTSRVASVQERKELLSSIARGNITDYQTSDGIHIDKDSPNTGAIETLETIKRTSRDSDAGSITTKRAVVPEALRNEIFERDGNRCVMCSSTLNLQLDHIQSTSKGGRTIASNLQTLCEACNRAKGSGKFSQPDIVTRLKLHNPLQAIELLNKMELVGGIAAPQTTNNTQYNIYVMDDTTRQQLAHIADRTIEVEGSKRIAATSGLASDDVIDGETVEEEDTTPPPGG